METLHKWSGAAFSKPLHSVFELPNRMKNKAFRLTIYFQPKNDLIKDAASRISSEDELYTDLRISIRIFIPE